MQKSKIYVINLKERPNRLNSFLNNCPIDKSNINIFNAINGHKLLEMPNYFKNLLPGEVGCFLSHMSIWKKLINDVDVDNYIIFEDDAKFTEKFLEKFNNLINDIIEFEEIIYIGGRFTKNY